MRSCEAKPLFPKLKWIKNKLTALTLLSIEGDFFDTTDFRGFIKDFSKQKSRKMLLW